LVVQYVRSIEPPQAEESVQKPPLIVRPVTLGLVLSFLLCLQALAVPARTAAQEGDQRAPVVEGAATQAAPTAVPSRITPLIGDFDGDLRSDVFMYGPGGLPDHVWLGRPDRAFRGAGANVGGSYVPLVGDFNGNGRADILWYGPGAGPDTLWYGKTDGAFSGFSLTVRGHYEPLLGDFNGDKRADILWYGPGAAYDVLWYGRSSGGFTPRAVTVRGTYQPLVGSFNGDGSRDILWYGPGGGYDVLWLGRASGGFSSRAVTIGRTYQPVLGDWNGDRSGDILWYGPGAAPDVLWFGHPDGRFTGRAINVAGTYRPFTGDFDADGRRDIFWYGPGAGYDVVWYGRSDSRFGAVAATVRGTYQPYVADYGGGGPQDVFWYAPGDPDDILWFGHANRVFTSRATTLDIGYTRAPPLRPQALGSGYDPYGFVAHAFGAIDRNGYTNSLEAFQRNYGRGFRVFEVDLVRLADGTALLAHDGLEANYGLNKSFKESTWADLAGHKYLGRYTILRAQELAGLLRNHPDMYVILDSKYSRLDIYRSMLRYAPERSLRERIFPHVEDRAELTEFRTAYPLQNFMLALYHTQAQNRYEDPIAADFSNRYRAPAVMMWWRDRDPSLSLAANGRESRRYRPSFARTLRSVGANVYVHSLGDPTQIQRFWNLGIGVYSDDPFPPLGGTTALRQAEEEELIMPDFPEGVIPA
jgi:glycerophosphoryl diester phosphodiesterase